MIVFKVSAARKEYEVAQTAAFDSDAGSVMCLRYRTNWVSPSVAIGAGDSAIISVPQNSGEGYKAARVATVLGVNHNDGVLIFTVRLTGDCPCDEFCDTNTQYFVTTLVDEELI